ncbi:MAG: hypothetical protein K2X32_05675, partial [Phycisphaerales bacterium]|nr:hypothetical protein [Phycisphaerales bacterium]
MPARRSLLRARWPLIALSLAIGLLLTLLTAFADDLLAPIRAHKQPLREFAADDRVILVRESRTAWSVLQISIYGDRPDLSSSQIIALAARTKWSTDPLVANAALNFPRQRTDRVVMLRGWPFLALHCWIDPSNGSALQLPIRGAFNLKFDKW